MQSYYRLKRYTATLTQFLLTETGATHRHLHKTPKKKKVATFLNASSSLALSTSTPSLPRCGPRARTSHLHMWPLNATNGASGTIAAQIMGEGKLLMLGVEGGMVDAPSRWRGLGTAG